MSEKLICVNCGKTCKTIIKKGNKVFCCDNCKAGYGKSKSKSKICKYC